MNKERILDVADMIENDRLPLVRFDMGSSAEKDPKSSRDCGTVACIAGYTVAAAYGNREAKRMGECGTVPREAARILGLTRRQALRLFTPPGWAWAWGSARYTKFQAVRTLRHFAETGEINWDAGA